MDTCKFAKKEREIAMNLKKILSLLVVMVMTLSVLVACGGQKVETGDGETSKDDPNAVELRVSYQQDNAEGITTKKLVKAFEEEQKAKGNSVKVVLVGIKAADYNKQILQMASTENLPDVIYTYDDYASQWAEKGVFENLDSYFANVDMSIYDDTIMDVTKVYKDSIYFAPREYNHPVIFVNTALFDKYGVDYKAYESGWTWSQFLDVCKKLRTGMNQEKTKDYLYPMESSLAWAPVYNAWIQSLGGYVFDAEKATVGLDAPETEAAIAELKKMIDDRLIADPRSIASGESFLNGNAAMYISSRPSVMNCLDSEISLAFLPMPTMEKGATYLSYGATGYAISSKSEKKDLAWEFLQFIISQNGQEIFSETGNCVPIIKSMQNDENATWRKSLEGINQDAFIISEEQQDKYTRILTAYARGYNPDKERNIYNQAGSLMKELSTKTVAEWMDYAASQLEGAL